LGIIVDIVKVWITTEGSDTLINITTEVGDAAASGRVVNIGGGVDHASEVNVEFSVSESLSNLAGDMGNLVFDTVGLVFLGSGETDDGDNGDLFH